MLFSAEECAAGLQLSLTGQCDPCPRGSYRTKGMAACQQCPPGRTTPNFGSTSIDQCSLGTGANYLMLNFAFNMYIQCNLLIADPNFVFEVLIDVL